MTNAITDPIGFIVAGITVISVFAVLGFVLITVSCGFCWASHRVIHAILGECNDCTDRRRRREQEERERVAEAERIIRQHDREYPRGGR